MSPASSPTTPASTRNAYLLTAAGLSPRGMTPPRSGRTEASGMTINEKTRPQRAGRMARERAGTREQRWVLALTSVASLMVSLDNQVVATALPAIRVHLHASLAALEWTVNAYTLSFAVLLLTGAALGERLGRRRMLAAGVGLFTAASAACALAPDAGALVAARALQGAGAALMLPLALALLSAAFPPHRRAWALGIFASVTGIAVLAGPVVGGAVTQGLDWPWIFWLNVPIGLVMIPLILVRIPAAERARVSLDPVGLA